MAQGSLTTFPQLIAERIRDGETVSFAVTEDWLQGRTAFGGLVSAYAAQAMRDVVGGAWPAEVSLRALQVSFVAPVGPGRVEVAVSLLREGKNVRQVKAEVRQNGETCSIMLGVFAAPRQSALPVVRPERPPPKRAAEDLPTAPFIPGVVPNFIQHVETRWAEGGLPFSGRGGTTMSIHMRPRSPDPAVVSNEVLTVFLADVTPTPVIALFTKPVPISSVSWALELRPLATEPGEGWWRADTEAVAAESGYVNQAGRLWAPDGSLAALAYQVVMVGG